jgi:Domain of unknown function (DUF1924)
MKIKLGYFCAFLVAASGAVALAGSDETHKPLLDFYAQQAKSADPAFTEFSAARGQTLFLSTFTGGKPNMSSCTACHTKDPTKTGQTRAGKDIEPMAASVNPKRYTDLEKTEKWFGRNCRNVLGRECTAPEKGDFITFMLTQ